MSNYNKRYKEPCIRPYQPKQCVGLVPYIYPCDNPNEIPCSNIYTSPKIQKCTYDSKCTCGCCYNRQEKVYTYEFPEYNPSSGCKCSKCCPKPEPKCKPACPEIKQKFEVMNLISNLTGVAPVIDPVALNSWGIVIVGGTLWVAQNNFGVLSQYNLSGIILAPTVIVPAATGNPADTGSPTGLVYNQGPNFIITNGMTSAPATLLTSTEDGTVAAYNASVNATTAQTVINRSAQNAVYKGLAITQSNIYVADFRNNRIDTFGPTFNGPLAGFPFADATIPSGYAPFNIVNIGDRLYVTYARQDLSGTSPVAGAGNGYINIFDINGQLIRRFVSNGYLNSPWAILPISTLYCHSANALLIGNNGDGTVAVYDENGTFLGRLRDKNCADIIIGGLWGLVSESSNYKRLFFASGPNSETNGLIGHITPINC